MINENEDDEFLKVKKVNVAWAKEDKEFEEIKKEVIEYITNNKEPIYSRLLNFIVEQGYSKNKVAEVLREGEGRYWGKRKTKTKK